MCICLLHKIYFLLVWNKKKDLRSPKSIQPFGQVRDLIDDIVNYVKALLLIFAKAGHFIQNITMSLIIFVVSKEH